MTNELIQKAKECKNTEELLALAKENGIEITAEQAVEMLAQLHNEGEISDDELDGAAGGACYKGKRMVTTILNSCGRWECKKCNQGPKYLSDGDPDGATAAFTRCKCWGTFNYISCERCRYISYEGGLWLCNHSANYK